MADTALSVIKAVVARLSALAPLQAVVGQRIYTDVPQNTDFPYVVISIQSKPFAANDFSGQEHTVRVQARSRVAGVTECLTVRKLVADALDRQEGTLTLSEGTLVKCEYSGMSDAFIEDDGKTWQAVSELDVIVV